MRIGIDATPWTNWRGFGRFTRSLTQALLDIDRTNEYVLFFDRTYSRCEGVPANARHVVVNTAAAQSEAIAADGRRSTSDMWRMTQAVARESLDVFFCPSIDSYYPVLGTTARVVMIHDVIPETLGATMIPDRLSRWRRRIKVHFALTQATVVATGSEYVRNQIVDVFGPRIERTAVIPYGVSARFRPSPSRRDATARVAKQHGLSGRFLLHVGGFGPNKNIPALLESFARLRADERFSDLMLVFVGRRDADAIYDEAQLIEERLSRSDLEGGVRFLGHQNDDFLPDIYESAEALLLPSRVEGFGLPAVEAVCCGTPAVVTEVSPLPELLGDAVLPIDPDYIEGLTAAISRVLTEPSFRVKARERAGQFGWEVSAQSALGVFLEASRSVV